MLFLVDFIVDSCDVGSFWGSSSDELRLVEADSIDQAEEAIKVMYDTESAPNNIINQVHIRTTHPVINARDILGLGKYLKPSNPGTNVE